MKLKDYLKNALLGCIGIFIYFFLGNYQTLPFDILHINTDLLPTYIKTLYSCFYTLLILSLICLVLNKSLKNEFNDLKKNHKKYFSECFKYYLISLAIMYISNFIIMFIINKSMVNNEEVVRNMFKINPIYVYISAVIFAPLTEELVFRKCIKNIFDNKYLFIAISGFIFGYLHIASSLNSMIDLIYIIPYASLGVSFAYIYEKTNNIFVSTGFHMMHNGILIGLQFLVLLFG